MKQTDIKTCCGCGNGVMHCNPVTCYTVVITQQAFDRAAISRAHGMEMVMGGAAALAQIMGPNEDITKEFMRTEELWICTDCAQTKTIIELVDLSHD